MRTRAALQALIERRLASSAGRTELVELAIRLIVEEALAGKVVPADVHEHRALRALAPDLAVQPALLLIWQGRGFAGHDPEAFLHG